MGQLLSLPLLVLGLYWLWRSRTSPTIERGIVTHNTQATSP